MEEPPHVRIVIIESGGREGNCQCCFEYTSIKGNTKNASEN